MTIQQKINMALAYKNTSLTTLAKEIGTSVQNLSQKIKRETLSTVEIEKIASALGAVYHFSFEFPDGYKI